MQSWCFHLSLNVASLPRAIEFYRVLFGMEPAKCHDDYAKFEVADPPVVFSLVPHAAGANAVRSQVGLRLTSQEQFHLIRSRLIAQGVAVKSSECGKSTYHFADPDGNRWQLFVDDALEVAACSAIPAVEAPTVKHGEPMVWEHFVTSDLPKRIPHEDASVDEVRLTGSFNGPQSDDARLCLVAEAFRVLRPGGKVVVHALAADQPLPDGVPKLPGLAAMVSHVPVHHYILTALRRHRFTSLQFTKFDAKAWFTHNDVGMRETKIVAWKPEATASGATCDVIYRGPFQQLRDDQGNTYVRGLRTSISRETSAMLRQSPLAEHFVFIESEANAATCQIIPSGNGRGA